MKKIFEDDDHIHVEIAVEDFPIVVETPGKFLRITLEASNEEGEQSK